MTIANRQKTNENKWPAEWAASSQKVANQQPKRTERIMKKHKVKHHRNSDTKTGDRESHQNHRLGTVNNELLVAYSSFNWSNLNSVADVVQTFRWLIVWQDYPLTHQ